MSLAHDPGWQHIHKRHLWQRLQQRVRSAQADPTRLALLAQEAEDLGFVLPVAPHILPYQSQPPLANIKLDRLAQTLQALTHRRAQP